ncbi:MAG: ABC transporter ATP-binding protein [Oscillospiraceae bacterium]|nr:ABC transporter ATP-binding protein [Oscillospiraceae bacterium]MDD6145752.1 ABC transporter ATP-binding protein [Oscillospiraceae bacterium]
MKDYAIEVNHVSMLFRLNKQRVDSAKEYFIRLVTKKLSYTEFWALKDVSFKIAKGERVGVMGFNGAGKSTLLKVIAGVLKPTMGSVKVSGTVAPMLELGAGFDPNYTGKENIYLYGTTMGFSRKFIEEKYDDIVEFSELEEFIDAPLKSYSSGMKSRLGFAIATAVKPDILILDEVLSVGDAAFKEKSEQRIMDMMEDGVTVLYVSHSTDRIRKLCNKAIILTKGQVVAWGEADEICDIYTEMVNSK